MKKLLTILSTVAIASLAFVSCDKNNVDVDYGGLLKLTVTPAAVDLYVGEEATLTVKAVPEDKMGNLQWTSSADSVVTVKDSVVTAVGAGDAVVSVKSGRIAAAANIHVFGGGSSEWSIIGSIHGTNWDQDFVMDEKDGAFVMLGLPLAKDEEFKLRKNKDWGVNRGGAFVVGTPFEAIPGGDNLKVTTDGYYDVYYFEAKDAIVILTAGAELPSDIANFRKPDDNWNYTPSEAYSDAANLWKPVDDANATKYFIYSCSGADWNGTDTETANPENLTKKQSTYRIYYENGTTQRWQNQFFIYPNGKSVALSADKKYKFSVTLGATKDMTCFFKLSQFNASNGPKYEGATINEPGEIALQAGKETVVTIDEIAGVACDNIILVFDFGTNPEWMFVYIKDITLVETGVAAAATIDGDLSEWASVTAIPSSATSRIREWKFLQDASNVYFYFAMRKNRCESSKKLVIGFNIDGDDTTGSLTDNNNMKGCEAIARGLVPFTDSNTAAATGNGIGEVVSTSGDTFNDVVICYAVPGTEDASSDSSNAYVELSIPKSKLGLTAGATIQVGASYDYYFAGYTEVTLQ